VGSNASAPAKDSLAAIEGWWGNSWSALQGAASNVLGSNILEATKDKPATQRRKRPSDSSRTRNSSTPPSKWGPEAKLKDKDIGATTKESREAMVRAKKREDLLNANGQMYPDAVGRFKRRNSDDRGSSSAPPAESDDRDALVYIHKVKPIDTMAGLTIKYNCQAAVLRKANRMWPSDTIQIRKHLMIPVDSCGVKGKMVPEPSSESTDLLGEPTEAADSGLSNGWHKKQGLDDKPMSSAASAVSTSAEEKPWKHDSWVMLGNDTDPTEIARLPRRNLGFFPAARRKSLTFSDAPDSLDLQRSTSAVDSPLHSPSASSSRLDLPSSARTSPGGTRRSGHRRRQDSITTTNPNFLPFQGPGGVGTFKKNVRKPGPANDGLNKIFDPYLPNLRPPPGQETSGWFGGGWNPLNMDPNTGVIPTNAAQVQQGGSGGIDIDFEKAAGAIEGWARNMWSKAQTAMKEPGQAGTPGSVTSPGRGRKPQTRNPVVSGYGEDVSDLIEMTDSHFDIGDDEDDEDELGRGRQHQSTGRGESSLGLGSKNRKGD
jgi:hypothetical protein